MAILDLPHKESDLVEALDHEIQAAELECNLWKTSWKLIDAYLEGVRVFRVLDPYAGTIELDFEQIDGKLNLRYEQVLADYRTEVGRYLKMDLSPVVTRKGESLDALRKAGIAHATLGSLVQPLASGRCKRDAIKTFLKYGTVGLEHWETGDHRVPDEIEIVNPRELLGLPAFVDGTQNLRGTVRKRWVPLDWLRRRLKDRFDKSFQLPERDLRGLDVAWGSSAPGEAEIVMGRGASSMPQLTIQQTKDMTVHGRADGPKQKASDEAARARMYVPLEEIYVAADNPTFLARYIIKVGDKVPVDVDFERNHQLVLPPLQVARHTDIGRFYGRGYVSPLIPMNDQVERMLASFFKNVIDLDIYGSILVPDSWGVDLDAWKAGRRPKAQKYTPDLGAPQAKLEVVQPVTSGTLPQAAANAGVTMLDRLAGQGPMFQGGAVGRMDSASGHGFVFDVANIALSLPSHSLADAFSGIYAKMLERVKQRVADGNLSVVRLAIIDDSVAGVVIDPSSGELDLTTNAVPDPWDVVIDIKDRTPRDVANRKQELLGLVQMQLVTPMQFWLTAFEEQLDIPGAPKDVIEAYRKALWQIIVLFGDGKEPGVIRTGPFTTNPEVQLIAVQRFMNKIEFALASREVRAAFESWKQTLENMLGTYPSGLAPPEVAAQQQAAIARQPQAGPPGGMM